MNIEERAKEVARKFRGADIHCDSAELSLVKHIAAFAQEVRKEALDDAMRIIEKIDDCPCHGSPIKCKTWLAWEAIRQRAGEVGK
jgi:hypothetical protein